MRAGRADRGSGSLSGLREERKLVSILFADLTGYTALTASLDPEEVYGFLRPGILELQRVVEEFGGTVPQIMGDGFMAVFGVPKAHEDDAERAVRAALAVRDHARKLGQQRRDIAFPEVHSGVNSGEVIVVPAQEQAGFAVIGDTVNTASRLADMAPPGRALVDQRTRDRTDHAIRYGPPRVMPAKGKSKGVVAHEAIETLVHPSVRRTIAATPFMDRERELARLEEEFRRAEGAGRARVLVVIGDPGVGKSRLASELRQRWRATVVTGRCPPFGPRQPLHALTAAVTEAAGVVPMESVRAQRSRLDRLSRRLAAKEGSAAMLRDLRLLVTLAGGRAERSPNSLHDAVRAAQSVVEGLARSGPAVLVLDDLQWADGDLLQVITDVSRKPWRGPILLLGLARSDFRVAGIPKLELPPLDDENARALASSLLGTPPSEDVLGVLIERAGGNPFFLEECFSMLVEAGSLKTDQRGWIVTDPEHLRRVPSSVRLVIAARLDGLPEAEKRALQDASVAGERTWDALLERNFGERAGPLLRRLQSRGLLRRRPSSSIPDTTEYEFRHVLIRDVAYESLARTERARIHADIAGWLRERSPQMSREPVALIAEHYERSWHLSRSPSLNAQIPDTARSAMSYLGRWGDEVRTFHPRAAEQIYRRGLRIADEAKGVDAIAEGRLLAGRSETLIEMGRHTEALRLALRAERRAARLDDRSLLARALLSRARILNDRGEPRKARPLLERALDVFRDLGDVAGQGWATHRLSETWAAESHDRQLRHLREAYALLVRAGDEHGRAVIVQDLAYGLTIRGGADFVRWHGEAERLGRDEGDLHSRAMALRSWGYFAHYRGDHAEAVRAMRDARPLAVETGDRYVEADAALIQATSSALTGGIEDAERLSREAFELGRAVGSRRIRAMALLAGARASLRAGRPGVGRQRLRSARRLLQPSTRLEVVDALATDLGFLLDAGVLRSIPDTDAQLREVVDATGWRLWEPIGPLALGRAQLASGDRKRAVAQLKTAARLSDRVGAPGHGAVARAALDEALLLSARPMLGSAEESGDAETTAIRLEIEGLRALEAAPETAAERFSMACDRWRTLGLTMWLARAHAMEAEALRRIGRHQRRSAARRRADQVLDALATPARSRAVILDPLEDVRFASPARTR